MDWESIRDNLGLIIFAMIWLLSFLFRALRGGSTAVLGKDAQRRRFRRRAVILGLVLMALAIGAWELSRGQGDSEAALLRIAALVLGGVALLAMLVAGVSRPGSAVQGDISFEEPEERAAEISRAEPLEPR